MTLLDLIIGIAILLYLVEKAGKSSDSGCVTVAGFILLILIGIAFLAGTAFLPMR